MVSTHTKTVLDFERSTLEEMFKNMPEPWLASFNFYGPLTIGGIYGKDKKDVEIIHPEIANLYFQPVSGHRINYNLESPNNNAVIELILQLKASRDIKLHSSPLNFGMIVWSNDVSNGQTTLYFDQARINLEKNNAKYTKPMMHFADIAYSAGLPIILNDKPYTK